MVLTSIAYVSVAAHPMSDDELAALLDQSRANNRREGLTGILLYKDRRFIQVIEGEDAALFRRYGVIQRDGRHRSLHLLDRSSQSVRQFSNWSMGFRDLSSTRDSRLDEITLVDGSQLPAAGDLSAQLFVSWLSSYWFSQPG